MCVCVKYYCRRRGWGASQSAGMGEAKKTLAEWRTHQSEWRAPPPEESTNSNKEHERLHQAAAAAAARGRMAERAAAANCHHQRAAMCAAWQLKTGQRFTEVESISFAGSLTVRDFFHNTNFFHLLQYLHKKKSKQINSNSTKKCFPTLPNKIYFNI